MPSYWKQIKTAKMLLFFAVFVVFGCQSQLAQSSPPLERQNYNDSIAAVSTDDDLTTLKQSVHERVNQYRATKNLPPLKLNSNISQQAKIHSENMASGKVPFSHNGFKERVGALKGEISYRRAAENLAYNSGYSNPVERAVTGWINSSGHRQNMLGDYNLTGIGVAKNQQGEYYFTQIFILE